MSFFTIFCDFNIGGNSLIGVCHPKFHCNWCEGKYSTAHALTNILYRPSYFVIQIIFSLPYFYPYRIIIDNNPCTSSHFSIFQDCQTHTISSLWRHSEEYESRNEFTFSASFCTPPHFLLVLEKYPTTSTLSQLVAARISIYSRVH